MGIPALHLYGGQVGGPVFGTNESFSEMDSRPLR